MNKELRFLFFLAAITTLTTAFIAKADEHISSRRKWVSLFDGKTLKGWHTIPGGEWKIENACIVGRSDKTDNRHGLLVTDKSFRDFEIKLKYKPIQGNSGLYFRVESSGDIVGVNGFQAEIDPEKDAGGLYETGGRGWVVKPSAEDVKKWQKPGEWNDMMVKAEKGHITVWINNYKTAELMNDPGRSEGHLALQLHGGMDMHVVFKDLFIHEL